MGKPYGRAPGCRTADISSVEVRASDSRLFGCANAFWMFFSSVLPSNSLPSVQIQIVERIPGIRRFWIFRDVQVFQPRPDALRLPVPIAMRMNRKSEEDILSNPWRQV